jgi:hypothetical protein
MTDALRRTHGEKEKTMSKQFCKGGSITMRKSLLLAAGLGICTMAPTASFAGKPVPCGNDVTNLSITVANDNPLYTITPDINAPYSTVKKKGEQINATFQISNCTYDFTLNLNFSSRYIDVEVPNMPTMTKFFNFDRIASVPITDGGSAFMAWCNGGVQRNPDGSIALVGGQRQDAYAPCGVDGDGHFARRSGTFILADNYGLRFQDSPTDGHDPLANDTTFIKVYHPSANQWVVVPDTDACTFTDYVTPAGYFTAATGELSALIYNPNNGPQVKVAQPIMPFRMVVTRP